MSKTETTEERKRPMKTDSVTPQEEAGAGSSLASCCASLSARQIEILDHTVNRAPGGRYCGGGEDMDSLVDIGLMKYIGTPAWCPDKFYAITEKGRAVLIQHNEPSPSVDAAE